MAAFVRLLFFGALGLLALIPVGILLAAIGLPVLVVVAALAVPLVVVLFLIGLPFIVLASVGFALLAATFGVIVAFLSLGVVVFKFAIIVLVPVMIVGWLLRRTSWVARGSGDRSALSSGD